MPLRKIQLDYLRAEWLLHYAQGIAPHPNNPFSTKDSEHDEKEYKRQLKACYDLYLSIRDRARDLGLKDEHRWMLDINHCLAGIETKGFEKHKEARSLKHLLLQSTKRHQTNV